MQESEASSSRLKEPTSSPPGSTATGPTKSGIVDELRPAKRKRPQLYIPSDSDSDDDKPILVRRSPRKVTKVAASGDTEETRPTSRKRRKADKPAPDHGISIVDVDDDPPTSRSKTSKVNEHGEGKAGGKAKAKITAEGAETEETRPGKEKPRRAAKAKTKAGAKVKPDSKGKAKAKAKKAGEQETTLRADGEDELPLPVLKKQKRGLSSSVNAASAAPEQPGKNTTEHSKGSKARSDSAQAPTSRKRRRHADAEDRVEDERNDGSLGVANGGGSAPSLDLGNPAKRRRKAATTATRELEIETRSDEAQKGAPSRSQEIQAEELPGEHESRQHHSRTRTKS